MNLTDIEPHEEGVVNSAGNVYVGKKHVGKEVIIYFKNKKEK